MTTRRQFVLGSSITALTGALVPRAAHAKPDAGKKPDDDDVPPTEDLMREHGVLRRILLVYGESARRLDAKQHLEPAWLSDAATIIREFIEDYHEKDEEEFLFPRLKKANKLGDLVDVLTAQHHAGRRLTADVLKLATPAALAVDANRAQLAATLRSFIRMYEAHAAREDTVLFPAFRALLTPKELDKLTDVFEDKEKALPHGGFETMVDHVAKLEQALGIYDLAKLTPA